MTASTGPLPVHLLHPHRFRRTRLAVAVAAAALLVSSCGVNGSDEASTADDTTTSSVAADTDAAETTTTEGASEPVTTELTDDVELFQVGNMLYETDLTSANPGGWAEGGSSTFGPNGMTVEVDEGVSAYPTASDEQYDGGVMVQAQFTVGGMEDPPDVARGVTCRNSASGTYVAYVIQSSDDANLYLWGISKKLVEEGTFEQLIGSGMGEDPISVEGTSLSVSLGCNETALGEQLTMYVGDQLAGVYVDIDPLAGAYAGVFVQMAEFTGPVLVTGYRVSEMVPA